MNCVTKGRSGLRGWMEQSGSINGTQPKVRHAVAALACIMPLNQKATCKGLPCVKEDIITIHAFTRVSKAPTMYQAQQVEKLT